MLYTIVTKEPVAAQLITLHNLWFMLLLGLSLASSLPCRLFSWQRMNTPTLQ